MAVKPILTEPNKLLRQVSKPVDKITKDEQKLMDDMLDTMYAANGIGLAAIQIGIPKRIIVMDISKDPEKKEPRYFVNPVIKNKDPEKATYEEGCLSVPNQFAEIDRPSHCDVDYLDYNGERQTLHASGLLATCIQHEMDHLEGVLFIDYLSKLKKSMIIKKLSKLKSNQIVI
ncbi:peptide deformylase [Candidatus Pelagibacter sp. HIMB1321]|uniref:peptide deformylase n=1 Tax=Candidatus Pelagibacter sp. HIMB1321 TaxID=1388755 RepID=UPI000A081C45|nr:peptide deformylase [Candidatus Pelagibacter sp. HIMB1321]SMF79918.1 peptide deformylase [Candidatus Pelagibacter sp. HIMB1321]